MNTLKDIVEQVQETPSSRCWESIASQLPAAGTAIGGGMAATAAKSTLAVGKLAAIIGSTAAVVSIVTIATVSILKHEPSTEQQNMVDNNTMAIVTDSVTSDESPVYLAEEMMPSSSNSNSIQTTTKIDKDKEISTTDIANTDQVAKAENTSIPSQTIIPATNTPSTNSVTTTSSSTTPKTQQNTIPQTNTTITQNTSPKQSENSNTTTVPNSSAETTSTPDESTYYHPIIIEIPNIFTPNGDGVNDLFVINGIEHCEKRMLIVKNQKGQTVFQSQHYDNSWDGANLPDGSYFYQFMYSINNINELRKGTILIRR